MNLEGKKSSLESSGVRWGHRVVPLLPVHLLGSVTEVVLSTLLLKQNFTFFLFNAISFLFASNCNLYRWCFRLKIKAL